MQNAGRRFSCWLLATTFAAVLASCDSDDDPVQPTDDFLPIISNTWHDVLNDLHTFSLVSQDDSTPSGTFTGEEDHPVDGLSTLDGTFQGRNITFTIHRVSGEMTYSGTFIHRDTMTLTSPEGAKRIAR